MPRPFAALEGSKAGEDRQHCSRTGASARLLSSCKAALHEWCTPLPLLLPWRSASLQNSQLGEAAALLGPLAAQAGQQRQWQRLSQVECGILNKHMNASSGQLPLLSCWNGTCPHLACCPAGQQPAEQQVRSGSVTLGQGSCSSGSLNTASTSSPGELGASARMQAAASYCCCSAGATLSCSLLPWRPAACIAAHCMSVSTARAGQQWQWYRHQRGNLLQGQPKRELAHAGKQLAAAAAALLKQCTRLRGMLSWRPAYCLSVCVTPAGEQWQRQLQRHRKLHQHQHTRCRRTCQLQLVPCRSSGRPHCVCCPRGQQPAELQAWQWMAKATPAGQQQ